MELILIIWRISTSMFRTLLDNQAFSERDQIRATFLPTKMNFCRPVSEREWEHAQEHTRWKETVMPAQHSRPPKVSSFKMKRA